MAGTQKRYLRNLLTVLVFASSFHSVAAEVVVVVSPENSVTSMSAEQIADIFLGRTNRFPDGTVALPIDQEEGSPARTEFVSRYIGQTPVQVKMHWSKLIFTGRGQPPRQVSDAREVKQLLAQNPNAIGYIDREFVDESVTVLSFTNSQ